MHWIKLDHDDCFATYYCSHCGSTILIERGSELPSYCKVCDREVPFYDDEYGAVDEIIDDDDVDCRCD